MTKHGNNEGFMSRWSKRKQAVAAGEDVLDVSPQLAETAPSNAPAEISEERAAELEANKLAAEEIDIDTLEYDSDFSAFFKDGVPSLLRQKALRVLWRSNPILANVDGLCDYDDNFADPSLILKKFESAYRIGKGYLFEEEETEGEDEIEAADAEDGNDDSAAEADLEAEGESDDDEILVASEEPLGDVPATSAEDTIVADSIIEQSDGQADNTPAMEEVPLERPRVSLRHRLQFDS